MPEVFKLFYHRVKYNNIKQHIDFLKNNFPIEEIIIDHIDEIKPIHPTNNCLGIIIMGGDGTLLRTIHMIDNISVPFYCFNFGFFGLLCSLEPENIKTFPTFNYKKRKLLTIENNCYFLNEALFTGNQIGNLNKFIIKINDKIIDTIDADSIIVSTPTGSTGYNLSANGPMVLEECDVIIINFVNSSRRYINPLIIPLHFVIEIEILSNDPLCYVDGCLKILKEKFKIFYENKKIEYADINGDDLQIYQKIKFRN